MEPNLYQGDFIIVSSIPYWFRNPQSGDVILFKDKDSKKQIVKRIVKINNKKYSIKGDNIKDSKEFEPILKKEIVGKVVYKL